MDNKVFRTTLVLAFGFLTAFQMIAGEVFQYNGLEYEIVSESPKTCKVVYCSTSTSGAVSIPITAQGYTVVEIADQAFNGCDKITSITIPRSIEQIGLNTFNGCSAIKTVNFNAINANYTSYDEYIFNCSPIENINFGNEVKTVPSLFIANAPQITSVVFPDQVDSIGTNAFYNCDGIKTITLGASIKAYTGFRYSVADGEPLVAGEPPLLEHIYVSENNPYITVLDDVIYKKDMSSISYYPNYRSNDIYNVPASLQSLGVFTFRNRYNLRVINISHDVEIPFWDEKHHYLSPFDNCYNLAEVNISNNSKYTSMSGIMYTKDKKKLAYYPTGRPNTTFTIPSTVEELYPYSLRNTSKLQNFTIPDNVKIIGENALYGCTSLTSVTIGSGVTVLPGSCFAYSKNLANVTLSDGLKIISASAFHNCTALSNITLPSSLKSIGSSAFGYTALQQITLPYGLLSISRNAFIQTQIQSLNIPSSVIYVGNNAFSNTPLLNNNDNVVSNHVVLKMVLPSSNSIITIPDNIKIIAGGALSNCYQMSEIIVPSTLESIGRSAIYPSCPWYMNLESGLNYLGNTLFETKNYTGSTISVRAGTKGIAGNAFYQSNITQVTLPVGLTTIGEDAFSSSKLTSVSLPYGLRYLGYDAFAYCSDLESVILPATVEVIDDYAFEALNNDSPMHSFYCYASTPPILSSRTFYYSGANGDIRENCTLYVPLASINLYKNTDGWKQFKFILPYDAELPNGDVNGDNIVDVDDMNAIINIILKTKTNDDYPCNADLNNDGEIDVDDMNIVINIILTQTD